MKKCAALLLVSWLLIFAVGCGSSGEQEADRKPVEFTVVEMRKVPAELAEIIEKNKKNEIRMTYTQGEELYLIRGYGEQKTGGYSIAVAECTEDEETVWLDTRLIGPQEQEKLSKEPSYPCLVIKMEVRDKEVMIQ